MSFRSSNVSYFTFRRLHARIFITCDLFRRIMMKYTFYIKILDFLYEVHTFPTEFGFINIIISGIWRPNHVKQYTAKYRRGGHSKVVTTGRKCPLAYGRCLEEILSLKLQNVIIRARGLLRVRVSQFCGGSLRIESRALFRFLRGEGE